MTRLTVLCLATLLLSVQRLAQPQDPCPEELSGCTCDSDNNLNVNCEGKGLTGLPPELRQNVEDLSLGNNRIEAIERRMFAHLTSLKSLQLNSNQIRSLPVDAFAGLEKLMVLFLSNNQITVILDDTFAGLINLRALHLYNNNLTTLGSNVVDDLPVNISVYLRNNPWRCDCALFETWRRFKSAEQQTKCKFPPTLEGREWNTLKEDEICPEQVTSSATLPSTPTTTTATSSTTAFLTSPPTSNWLSIETIVVIILAVICCLSLVSYFVWKAIRKSSDKLTGQRRDLADSGSEKESAPLLGDSFAGSSSD